MRKYLLTFLAVFALLCCAAVPAFADEEGETLSEVWTEVEGSTYIGEPSTASGGSGTVVRPVDNSVSVVQYHQFMNAKKELEFDVNGVTQESDFIIDIRSGKYFLYFFSDRSVLNTWYCEPESSNYSQFSTAFGVSDVPIDCLSTRFPVRVYEYNPYSMKWDFVKDIPETPYGRFFLTSDRTNVISSKTYVLRENTISENVSKYEAMHRPLTSFVTSKGLSEIWQTIKPLIPIVAVSVAGFLAFRKGWSFLKGEAASA